jgi:hypothetical protein
VIDHGIVNEEAWERVEEFRTGERAESDHFERALRKRRGGKEQIRKGVFLSAVLTLKNKRGARNWEDEREDEKRKFKNKVENAEGRD